MASQKSTTLYSTNPSMIAFGSGRQFVALNKGQTRRCPDIDLDLVSKILDVAKSPQTHLQLVTAFPRELIDKLIDADALSPVEVPPESPDELAPKKPVCKHLVFGLTGAIETVRVYNRVTDLLGTFAERISVILTKNAQRWVKPDALSYFGIDVWTDEYQVRASLPRAPHVALGEDASMIVISPASARTISRLVNGSCDDLLSLTVAGASCPVVVFPAMAPAMWGSPAIARNISRLRQDGFYVVEPGYRRRVGEWATRGNLPDARAGRGLEAVLHSVMLIHEHAAGAGNDERED